MKPRQAKPTGTTLARLKRQLHEVGITHERVAEEASKTSRRGTVGVTTVSKVLAGTRKSENVVETCKRMVAEAKSAAPVAV